MFEKMSISLFSGKNSRSKEEKEEMILLNLLSISTIKPLIFRCCLGISPFNIVGLVSNNDLMMWFNSKGCVLSWNLPFSFWIWRWMGISLVMASISKVEVVQKAPKIYNIALLCILLGILRRYKSGALLKYHNWKP